MPTARWSRILIVTLAIMVIGALLGATIAALGDSRLIPRTESTQAGQGLTPTPRGDAGGASPPSLPTGSRTPQPTFTALPPTPTPQPVLTTTPANPTATPFPESVAGSCTASDVLNLRTGPGTNYPAALLLQPGDQLVPVGRNEEATWVRVVGGENTIGWVSAEFITCQNVTLEELLLSPIPPSPTAAPPAATSPTAPPPTPPPAATSPAAPPPTSPAATPVEPAAQTAPPENSVTIRLEDTEWQGGYRRSGEPTIYGGRSATWIYGTATEYQTMQATFDVSGQPAGRATLSIEGMDSEGPAKTEIAIRVNDVEIFNGPNPLPDDDLPLESGTWASYTWEFDAALLRPGPNVLAISNLAEGVFGLPPFFMLDYADITYGVPQ